MNKIDVFDVRISSVFGYEDIHDRYWVARNGDVLSVNPKRGKRLLKPQRNTDGYIQYSLYRAQGGARNEAIAPLVLTAFGSARPGPDYECDHIDSDKRNNAVSNLRWLHKDAHPHGKSSPLNDAELVAIATAKLFGDPVASIARDLHREHRQVGRAAKGQTYKGKIRPLRSDEFLIVPIHDGRAKLV